MPGPLRDFIGYGPEPPDFDWPGGARIAVNLVVNYEEGGEYSLNEDGVNDTWGEYSFQYGPDIRDIGTETHMEYGSRVGIWRLCRLIDRYRIPVTFSACALAVERNPPLGEWLRARDHDVLAHGYHWYGPDAVGMNRDQERDEVRRAVDSLLRTTGQRARGWMVRSFPTVHTRELLVEHGGFLYDSDANNDELPYYTDTLGTPFLVVPYSKVHNDVRYLIAPTYATPRHFFESLRGSLDYLLDEARHGYGARLMTVGVHARWSGQPGRAAAVRDFIDYALGQDGVRFMRRIDVAEFWTRAFPPRLGLEVVPGASHPDHRLAGQEPPDVLGRHAHADVKGVVRNAGIVRGPEQVGQVEERIRGAESRAWAGLMPPGVDPGAEVGLTAQVLVEGPLVHDGGPPDVHQDRGRFHQAQLPLADQAPGGVGQGQGYDEHVRGGEHLVKIGQRADELDRLTGAARGVDGVDARPEGAHQPGGGPADTAEAQDRAHGAVQGEHAFPHLEFALGQIGVALRQPPGQGQRHRHDVLRHRLGVGAHVAGERQPLRDGGEVHGIGAGRQELDQPETGCGLQGTGRQFLAQVPPDEHVGLTQGVPELSVRGTVQERDFGQAVEDTGIDLDEFCIHRVADRHQRSAGHSGSSLA
jgi:peptidoglycan/xylan/chitin deacetylase (PgdA/CDA1 family)